MLPPTVYFNQEFAPGDLIYGLRREIARYADSLHLKINLDAFDVQAATVDQYVVPREVELSTTGRCRFYNMTLPKNIPYFQNFISYLADHPKYHTALTYPIENNSRISGRKCKGALSWVTLGNNALTENMHIHFLLDGINMKYVVNKKPYPGNPDLETNVTARELRWIYRNKDHPQVQRKILFWLNRELTSPPWTGNGAVLWRNYVPHHIL
ncbi:hypothetical protein [Xenorhabdus griffiniae]|uniref:hypothetical protein n=1 Tax=Xenorhabdus griffiniae TaxID=351672 RepID=UPI0023594196|nr:hypothetical protein [Xenorhabdus griffiniae]MDC9604135.1 hypothetical protein [Xenorhabdus griffiniae]